MLVQDEEPQHVVTLSVSAARWWVGIDTLIRHREQGTKQRWWYHLDSTLQTTRRPSALFLRGASQDAATDPCSVGWPAK